MSLGVGAEQTRKLPDDLARSDGERELVDTTRTGGSMFVTGRNNLSLGKIPDLD